MWARLVSHVARVPCSILPFASDPRLHFPELTTVEFAGHREDMMWNADATTDGEDLD